MICSLNLSRELTVKCIGDDGASSSSSSHGGSSSSGSSSSSSPNDTTGSSSQNGGSTNRGNGNSSPTQGSDSGTSSSSRGGNNSNSASKEDSGNDTSSAGGSSASGGSAPDSAQSAASEAVTPAAATPATAAAPATTPLASTVQTTLVTVITASDGSLSTSTIPIGAVPTDNPFAAVASSSVQESEILGPTTSSIEPSSTAVANNSEETSSGPSKGVQIGVPVGVVVGVILIGLLVALGLAKHRRWMEKQLHPERNVSNTAAKGAAAGGTGALFAGARRKLYRRGVGYRHSTSSVGALSSVDAHSQTSLRHAIQNGELQYDDQSSVADSGMRHMQQVAPSSEAPQLPVSLARPAATHHADGVALDDPFSSPEEHGAVGVAMSSSHGHFNPRRESFTSGEGGYATADDPDTVSSGHHHGPSLSNHEPTPHWDGSASYGYSNPSARGMDAAALQSSTGQPSLSPYANLQRGESQLDPRQSLAPTEISTGNPDRAYSGADFLMNEPFNYKAIEENARPNPNYDGAANVQDSSSKPRIRSFFNLRNSSRWSG